MLLQSGREKGQEAEPRISIPGGGGEVALQKNGEKQWNSADVPRMKPRAIRRSPKIANTLAKKGATRVG